MYFLPILIISCVLASSIPSEWPHYSGYGSKIIKTINTERKDLGLYQINYDYQFMSELDIYKQVQGPNWFNQDFPSANNWTNETVVGPSKNFTRMLRSNGQLIFLYASFDDWRAYGYKYLFKSKKFPESLNFRIGQRDCFNKNGKLKDDPITEPNKKCSFAFNYYNQITDKELSRISCISLDDDTNYCYGRTI